jgi:hypothetical protein
LNFTTTGFTNSGNLPPLHLVALLPVSFKHTSYLHPSGRIEHMHLNRLKYQNLIIPYKPSSLNLKNIYQKNEIPLFKIYKNCGTIAL